MYKVSRIILGTVQFGLAYGINNSQGKVSKKEVFEILEYVAFKGINTLDTADGYGDASKVIGEFCKVTGYQFLVNTKFTASSVQNIKQQLQQSLELLQTDSINVYFYHHFKDFEDNLQIRDQLYELKRETKIAKIGVSIYSNDEFGKAINIKEVDVIQIPFNLLDNYSQRGSLIKKAKHAGKQIQIRSVFLQGLFFKDPASYPEQLAPLKTYMKTLREIMTETGQCMEQLAMTYAMAHVEIDNIIIGVDNKHQLARNLSYISSQVDHLIVDRINTIDVKETELLYPTNWT